MIDTTKKPAGNMPWDVQYIRADIHEAQIKTLRDALERMLDRTNKAPVDIGEDIINAKQALEQTKGK